MQNNYLEFFLIIFGIRINGLLTNREPPTVRRSILVISPMERPIAGQRQP